MTREGKGKWGSQGYRGQEKRDFGGGQVGSITKKVKWNDPQKCLWNSRRRSLKTF